MAAKVCKLGELKKKPYHHNLIVLPYTFNYYYINNINIIPVFNNSMRQVRSSLI